MKQDKNCLFLGDIISILPKNIVINISEKISVPKTFRLIIDNDDFEKSSRIDLYVMYVEGADKTKFDTDIYTYITRFMPEKIYTTSRKHKKYKTEKYKLNINDIKSVLKQIDIRDIEISLTYDT